MTNVKNIDFHRSFNQVLDSFWIIIFLSFVGLFIIIAQFFKFDFSIIPGGIADGRFNNYILEHNYLWITGRINNFWSDSGFFYPFSCTLAFSSNHLGTGFIYGIYRILLDRETSYQAWLLTGFIINYTACAYTLMRLQLRPLAVAVGAFIFSFGLPIIPQLDHSQLLYRFGVPLTLLYLFEFIKFPCLRNLTISLGWFVWQFYVEIYIGYFLALLLISILFTQATRQSNGIYAIIKYWPQLIIKAWNEANIRQKTFFIFIMGFFLTAFFALLIPYITTSKIYEFNRSWGEIESMLPRIGSYFLAEHYSVLKYISMNIKITTYHLSEHQLFFGFIPILLCIMALIWKRQIFNQETTCTIVVASLTVFFLTIYIDGLTFYKVLASLPGLSAIRAVTRISLVFLFTVGLIAAITIDTIIRRYNYSLTSKIFLLLLVGSLVLEVSLAGSYPSVKKSVLKNRIIDLKTKLPSPVPDNPILFVASLPNEPFWAREIDAMLLAQELGWKTLNGYSGNFPPGYAHANNCRVVIKRLFGYLDFAKKNDESHYLKLIRRVVLIGFNDCELSWWERMPQI